mmetsp:Transcript_996/g.1772  ORF Transcript_996/g.1772 Transcript_996/m.1772 type:complete len:202 (-) Transcript_996:236-841(-)|eukprot:CAMPEP_0176498964 /NCGR_PEP_ID=MMETSP0200_2-20121128/12644_1 /TAXON_ID=947934 /ORGANISM="Chaetoceros sp., Strain GSL56" /LENGTH=201 /DNA_ID=CAMNT_0017897291 /DNA_START=183 /DNA_END=788 /DNA_ORIENTATION=+
MTAGRLNYWGEPNDRPYKVEGPCITRTINAYAVGAAAGTAFAACQLAWYPDPVQTTSRFIRNAATSTTAAASSSGLSDSRAILRTIARPAFWMSAAGAAFAAAECTAEAARGKSDSWNATIGGMAAGLVAGAVSQKPGIMVSTSLGLGLFMFALDMTSPSSVYEGHQDEVTHKMYGVLPKTHKESEELADLKEKYPKFQNL